MAITRPLGFRSASGTAGIKKSGKPDLTLIVCDETVPEAMRGRGRLIEPRRSAAAVFTRNVVIGAPIEIGLAWRQRNMREPTPLRALLINSGNSNAATGEPGVQDARACMAAAAASLQCTPDEVLPSSTGIIGRRLPVDPIRAAIPALASRLARGEEADAAAAAAIMTTDLVPKTAHREIEIDGHQVHIGAIAKGSGMIAPKLDAFGTASGTMLAFITTDAAIDSRSFQAALERAAAASFDRISVDAHPSCSDTVIALASGAAAVPTLHKDEPRYHVFAAALTSVCQELAEKIVRDGEGATRIFRVDVRGAASDDDAARIARAVVDSPLVKCAVHGKDPNWGRIVTAAGNAGVRFDPRETSLIIGGIELYRSGVPTGVSPDDLRLRAAMAADPVEMTLSLGAGDGHAWMLGCDLAAEYVSINALYTT